MTPVKDISWSHEYQDSDFVTIFITFPSGGKYPIADVLIEGSARGDKGPDEIRKIQKIVENVARILGFELEQGE